MRFKSKLGMSAPFLGNAQSRTVSTGHGARRTTRSAVLPKKACWRPPSP